MPVSSFQQLLSRDTKFLKKTTPENKIVNSLVEALNYTRLTFGDLTERYPEINWQKLLSLLTETNIKWDPVPVRLYNEQYFNSLSDHLKQAE